MFLASPSDGLNMFSLFRYPNFLKVFFCFGGGGGNYGVISRGRLKWWLMGLIPHLSFICRGSLDPWNIRNEIMVDLVCVACLLACLVAWFVGWLVGWSDSRSVGWLVRWSVGRSVGQWVGWLVGRCLLYLLFVVCCLKKPTNFYHCFIVTFSKLKTHTHITFLGI